MTVPARLPLLHAAAFVVLLVSGTVHAAAQHALTLYDEKPKYSADFTHFDYANPDAPKGGTLREAGFGSFDSLNPFINKGVAADDVGLIYDTLTAQSLDEPFTVYGLLAERIEKGPNNQWVRFYLRPEARFHDGEPVKAEDVSSHSKPCWRKAPRTIGATTPMSKRRSSRGRARCASTSSTPATGSCH